jgi:hypothetical protein
MKKPSNENEKPRLAITATMEELCMLQLLVETLAESNADHNFRYKKVHAGWKTIKTSSIEARVSGSINLSDIKSKNIPFVTGFAFTCKKAAKGKYELTWSSSLS